jgi:uncharacterized GH25 family protein
MKWWLSLAAMPLGAQGLYIVPASFSVTPGERVAVVFHNAARPEDVRDATLYTAVAAYNVTNLKTAEGGAVTGDASIKAEGTLILCAGAGGRASGKALLVSRRPGPAFNRRVGLPLEIVPERDPYTLKAEDPLPLLILLRGKPAACAARLKRLDAPDAAVDSRSDIAGRVQFRLAGTGKWLITAVARDGTSTSLTFEVP